MEVKESGSIDDLLNKTEDLHRLTMDDKITVSVWNHQNVSLGSIFSIYSSHETFGKWVLIDSLGNATLPKIGPIRLVGLTTLEAGDVIANLLKEDLIDPVVVVRILNREVTVLGEVKSPGNYLMDKEVTTLYEALGKSEGFLQYSNLKKVQIIRDDISYVIDLRKNNGQALHAIKMQAGDIVNIPAKWGKNFDLSIKRIIPFASALTAIAVFSTLLK